MDLNKTYDAIILPTGETSFGDRSFPVSNEAIRLFNSGKFGCIFVTGGYNGFARFGPDMAISEAWDTANFLKTRNIPEEKIFYDPRSLESVGNFTFPIVRPIYQNPNLLDFNKMLIIGKEGHIWRLKEYAELTIPSVLSPPKNQVEFHAVPGKHNNGLCAKAYHAGIMHALSDKDGAEEIHDFLMKEHPFYSEGWYDKSPLQRKLEMGLTAWKWLGK